MGDDVLIIGNTLDETAYHEAGHIVVATAVELDLRPKGITIWEAAPNVMDGLAGYWNHETDWEKNRGRGVETKARELQEVTKEVVGTHVLPIRSLFFGGILRRLLLRVSLAKPTSAPLRF